MLLATAHYAGAQSVINADLVADGGFEDPAGGHWTVESGSVNSVGTFWQTAEGNFLLELNGTDPGTIYQDLATQPGRSYTIRFAYAGDPDQECEPAVKTFKVFWAGTQIASLQFDTTGRGIFDMGWQYYQAQVTASGSVSRLRFQSTTAGSCGPALDDVSVVKDTIKLATVNATDGWTFHPFLNGGGSQYHISTNAAINTTGLVNPAPQAVYQQMQPEFSTLTVNNLIPTMSYRVRVHLSSIDFWGSQNVLQDVWVSNGGSPNWVGSVNPYSSGFNRATIVDLGQIQPTYPGYSGQLFIGITPSTSGKSVIVSGIEIFKDP
jgi:hypothetical protein